MKIIGVAAIAAAFAASMTNATSAAPLGLSAYQAQVNALCRANTPRFKQLETDMAHAKLSGDLHRAAYDFGAALALTLKQGAQIEKMPLPANAGTRMNIALRALHAVDLQLHRVIAAAVANDSATLRPALARLSTLSAPLNSEFDAAGLRDCGSNQQ
jgi:hypothetical protein